MTWNYRVTREAGTVNGVEWTSFTVREVYYDEAGKVTAWTGRAIAPFGETREELALDLHLMAEANALPVVDLPPTEHYPACNAQCDQSGHMLKAEG